MHCYAASPLEERLKAGIDTLYLTGVEEFIERYVEEPHRRRALRALALDVVIEKLAASPCYTVSLPLSIDGGIFWKKWGFFWLDTEKPAIIMTRSDHTQEETLREHSAEIRTALINNNTVVFHYDIKKLTLTMPEDYAKAMGLPAVVENVPYGRRDVSIGDRAAYLDFYERIRSGEESGEARIQFIRADGSTVWKQATFTTSFDDYGAPLSAVVTARDISAQVAAEVEGERNRMLVRLNDIGIIDYDVKSDAMHYETNIRGKGYFQTVIPNYRSFALKSKMIHPDFREQILRLLDEASAVPLSGTLDYLSDNWGTGYRWSRLSYAGVADDNGRVYRILGQISDIQAEKEREKLLAELDMRQKQNESLPAYDPLTVTGIFEYLSKSHSPDEAIGHVLEVVGRRYGIDRAYIFEDSKDHRRYSCTFEWCSPGREPEIDRLQNWPYDGTVGLDYAKRFDEDGVFFTADKSILEEAHRKYAEKHGIHSALQYAIKYDGVFSGFIGFDDCRSDAEWSAERKGTLTLMARVINLYLYRKRERESADLSEDFMASIDGSTSMMYIVDPENHKIVYANSELRSRFGRLVGEVCYKAAIHRDSPCEECPIAKYRESGRAQAVEVLRHDGLWMLAQASPLRWNGRAMFILTCLDISAQKATENALRASAEENAIVIRQSGKYVIRYNLAEGTAENTPEAEALFRLPAIVEDFEEEMIRRGIVTRQSEEEYRGFFRKMRSGRAEGSCDVLFRRPADGAPRWYHADFAMVSENGVPDHAIIFFYDSTEQREREALRSVKRELESVITSMPGSVYRCRLYGGDVELEYVSERACEMLGYSREELFKLFRDKYPALFFEEDRATFIKAAAKLREEPQTVTVEYRLRRRDGSFFWASDTIKSVRQPDGEMWVYGAITEIDREHAALARLRALTDSVPGGIIIYEYDISKKQLSMTYFNDGLCDITGCSRAEYERMAKENAWVLTFEEDKPSLTAALNDFLKKGGLIEHEYRIQTKTGFCWVHLTAKMIEKIGDVISINAVLMDVTERKRAEEQIAYHNYCLDKVDGALSAGTVINGLALSTPVFYVSQNMLNLVGCSREEFMKMHETQYREIIHPDDLERVLALNDFYMRKRPADFEMEFRFVRRDGSVFWVLEKGSRLDDFHGQQAYISVFVDISRQKAEQEQLRMKEEAYRIAVSHSNSIVYRFDIEKKSIYMPPDIAANWHLPSLIENVPDGVVEAGYIASESADDYVSFYNAIASGEDGRTCEINRKLFDGKYRWFRGEYTIIRAGDGKPASAVVTFTDINEKMEKEAEISSLKKKRAPFTDRRRTLAKTHRHLQLRGKYAETLRRPFPILPGHRGRRALPRRIYNAQCHRAGMRRNSKKLVRRAALRQSRRRGEIPGKGGGGRLEMVLLRLHHRLQQRRQPGLRHPLA